MDYRKPWQDAGRPSPGRRQADAPTIDESVDPSMSSPPPGRPQGRGPLARVQGSSIRRPRPAARVQGNSRGAAPETPTAGDRKGPHSSSPPPPPLLGTTVTFPRHVRKNPTCERPVSLGIFTYLNIQPVYYGLLHEQGNNDIKVVTGIPTRLNQALLSGEVDISCVSGSAYAQHCNELRLIPQLSISAAAAVESVLLFSRYDDWRKLDGKNVAVTNHSASAVALVRVLCKHRYQIEPHFVTMPSDLEAMFTTCDAALVIGDTALIEGTQRREIAGVGFPTVFDLGQEWAEWTGLPFVFGVWAARADRAEAIQRSGILEQLYRSKAQGLAHIDDIGREQAPRVGLSPAVLSHYLRQMTYDLSDADLQGWQLFLELSLPTFRWQDIRWL